MLGSGQMTLSQQRANPRIPYGTLGSEALYYLLRSELRMLPPDCAGSDS
jgi:hypothetical protein